MKTAYLAYLLFGFVSLTQIISFAASLNNAASNAINLEREGN